MRALLLAGTAATLISWSAAASPVATVVTFDDLIGDDLVVPEGYGGITWGGQWTHFDDFQPGYTPASNFQRVYPTGGAASASFSFAAPVVFNGAFFSGYPESQFTQLPIAVTFSLYLAGNLVHTSSSLTPSSTPTFLASGYVGLVDEVIVGSRENFWVMDDGSYGGTAVPAPAALGLFCLGLLGLALAPRRLRRAG
jgi:hypothetical protein